MGEEVILIEHERLEQGGHRGGGPRAGIAFYIRKHERSRVGQLAVVRLTGTQAPLLGSPHAPRGGARRRWTTSHSNSTKVDTKHRNPASPQGT